MWYTFIRYIVYGLISGAIVKLFGKEDDKLSWRLVSILGAIGGTYMFFVDWGLSLFDIGVWEEPITCLFVIWGLGAAVKLFRLSEKGHEPSWKWVFVAGVVAGIFSFLFAQAIRLIDVMIGKLF